MGFVYYNLHNGDATHTLLLQSIIEISSLEENSQKGLLLKRGERSHHPITNYLYTPTKRAFFIFYSSLAVLATDSEKFLHLNAGSHCHG